MFYKRKDWQPGDCCAGCSPALLEKESETMNMFSPKAVLAAAAIFSVTMIESATALPADNLAGAAKASAEVQHVQWRGGRVGWRGAGWRGGVGWRGAGWRGAGWRGVGWRGVGWRGAGWRRPVAWGWRGGWGWRRPVAWGWRGGWGWRRPVAWGGWGWRRPLYGFAGWRGVGWRGVGFRGVGWRGGGWRGGGFRGGWGRRW
jgi:hypothetical protein